MNVKLCQDNSQVIKVGAYCVQGMFMKIKHVDRWSMQIHRYHDNIVFLFLLIISKSLSRDVIAVWADVNNRSPILGKAEQCFHACLRPALVTLLWRP